MKDIAREAGVSLGTVSNVLNGRSSVSAENRQRVMSAVEQLDYKSNMVARALRTGRAYDIGLIIPNIHNPFYPELARGAEDTARAAGYTAFLCNSDRDVHKEHGYIQSLIMNNVSGIITVKPQMSGDELSAMRMKTNIVLVDAAVSDDVGYDTVNVDDAGGIFLAMEFLCGYGHKKIAFVGGLPDSPSSYNRYNAYKQFAAQGDLDVNDDYIIHSDYSFAGGYRAAQRFMQMKNPPTAILASNDLMAIGCMKAAWEMGISVPCKLSVMGIDDIGFAELCTPPLTTIHQPKYEIGAESVKILMRRLKNPSAACERVVLKTHLVIRGSVDMPYSV